MNENLNKLHSIPGNEVCADCLSPKPEAYVTSLNILICRKCAGIHRSMDNRVKDLKYDNITKEELEDIIKNGNKKSNQEYLKYLPIFYRLPNKDGPEILRKIFIKSKYESKEFQTKEKERPYITTIKLGLLKKRCKDRNRYNPRFFRLSITEISFNYFIKQSDAIDYDKTLIKIDPKRNLRLDKINATFIINPESKSNDPQVVEELLMVSFFRQEEGSWRHIYLKANNPEDLVEWYQTIRFAKFSLKAAYVLGTGDEANEMELAKDLTLDISMCGWLYKTGSLLTEPWQKRWCVLLGRRLLYSSEALSPSGKGEIVIGEKERGYSAKYGNVPSHCRGLPTDPSSGNNQSMTALTIQTPSRLYLFAVPEGAEVARQWAELINSLAEREMSIREMADYQLHTMRN